MAIVARTTGRGVRVAALVNGGFLPEAMRGRKLEEPMHEADWYHLRNLSMATVILT
jgi:hypothetical protein